MRRAAPRARVLTLCPGVDTARLHPAARAPRERSRVLFVGGRFAEKGGYDLLDALAEDLGHAVELDVVTGDPLPERPGVRVHRLEREDRRLLELYPAGRRDVPADAGRLAGVGADRGDGVRHTGDLDIGRRIPSSSTRGGVACWWSRETGASYARPSSGC